MKHNSIIMIENQFNCWLADDYYNFTLAGTEQDPRGFEVEIYMSPNTTEQLIKNDEHNYYARRIEV